MTTDEFTHVCRGTCRRRNTPSVTLVYDALKPARRTCYCSPKPVHCTPAIYFCAAACGSAKCLQGSIMLMSVLVRIGATQGLSVIGEVIALSFCRPLFVAFIAPSILLRPDFFTAVVGYLIAIIAAIPQRHENPA